MGCDNAIRTLWTLAMAFITRRLTGSVFVRLSVALILNFLQLAILLDGRHAHAPLFPSHTAFFLWQFSRLRVNESMQTASLFDRVRARAPAYWPLMREEPLWAVMFAFSRINAARRIERFISSAEYKKPREVSNTVFSGLDLKKVVSTLIDEGVYLGLQLPDSIVREVREFADTHPVFTKDAPKEGFLPGLFRPSARSGKCTRCSIGGVAARSLKSRFWSAAGP